MANTGNQVCRGGRLRDRDVLRADGNVTMPKTRLDTFVEEAALESRWQGHVPYIDDNGSLGIVYEPQLSQLVIALVLRVDELEARVSQLERESSYD